MTISIAIILICVFSFPLNLVSSTKSTKSKYSYATTLVANEQLDFWSQNVNNNMPKNLISKLSNLTLGESAHFASWVSNPSITSNAKFCSVASLACASRVSHVECYRPWFFYYHSSSILFEHIDEHSFFTLSKLKEGQKIYLSNLTYMHPHRAFLPYEIASKISLNTAQLKKIFPQSFTSKTTEGIIQKTLSFCNARASKGEVKSCPTSLEGIIEFSKGALDEKRLLVMSSYSANGSGRELLIENVTRFNIEKIVSCHEVFLPFSIYYCHILSSSRLYSIDLVEPNTRESMNRALVICHMDTSSWSKSHVAFRLLNSSPGLVEACHWMPLNDLALIRGR